MPSMGLGIIHSTTPPPNKIDSDILAMLIKKKKGFAFQIHYRTAFSNLSFLENSGIPLKALLPSYHIYTYSNTPLILLFNKLHPNLFSMGTSKPFNPLEELVPDKYNAL